jgi:hypothetical protein
MTPYGERIVDNLPFIGTVDSENVTYRQQLAAMALSLITENPFFGTPFVLTYLESLRQGQGIIDLINAYATVAMYYGLVGLALFLGPFLIAMRGALRLKFRVAAADADLALLGCALLACMTGTLFNMAVGGIDRGQFFFLLAGLATGYAGLSKSGAFSRVPFAHANRLAGIQRN